MNPILLRVNLILFLLSKQSECHIMTFVRNKFCILIQYENLSLHSAKSKTYFLRFASFSNDSIA
jgi:hypothetical protein